MVTIIGPRGGEPKRRRVGGYRKGKYEEDEALIIIAINYSAIHYLMLNDEIILTEL